MANEKKVSEKETKKAMQEIDLDDLENVQGGSIKNVSYTKTTPISSDTKNKI
ncbi:MAG: hypothetical protein LIO53_07870 [Oscillospiraceae bacterium]|nr:hypothetical protein [Oscillospiraceae bacterium]